jgi:hypothetical protein
MIELIKGIFLDFLAVTYPENTDPDSIIITSIILTIILGFKSASEKAPKIEIKTLITRPIKIALKLIFSSPLFYYPIKNVNFTKNLHLIYIIV